MAISSDEDLRTLFGISTSVMSWLHFSLRGSFVVGLSKSSARVFGEYQIEIKNIMSGKFGFQLTSGELE